MKSVSLEYAVAPWLLGMCVIFGCGSGEEASREGDASASSAGQWSIERAEVLFTGRRDGVSDLYVLDRASGETRRLTRFGSPEGGANAGRVSPDGKRVAFQVRRDRDYEIYVMDLDGGSAVNLTNHPEFDVLPVWSPDGRSIAFMSTRGFELGGIGPFPGHIYIMNLSDRSLRQVTQEPLTSSLGPSAWSADGATMLMARVTGERPDVFLLDVETGSETQITSTPEAEYSAVFSGSGDRIAFHSEGDEASQIVVSDLDGANRREVTSGPGLRYNPRWSPDDAWILFTFSSDGKQYDLRAVRVSDGHEIEVVTTPEDEREGYWLPSN